MPGDVAVALSFSGETPELANLIAHTKRLGIPLIGIAGTAASNLIRRSDVGIVLPKAKEACDRGIVPTTSAIMTLAVGDALAVALMNHRRFTPEQFREFHPGGNLGARLSKVRDIMHTGSAMPLVNDDMDMAEALLEMTRKGFEGCRNTFGFGSFDRHHYGWRLTAEHGRPFWKTGYWM